MRQILHITENEYKMIAEAMSGCEEGRHEVEVRIAPDVDAVIDFTCSVTYREIVGGSYEGYDFERYNVEDSRAYSVKDCSVYVGDEEVDTDFNVKELENRLN